MVKYHYIFSSWNIAKKFSLQFCQCKWRWLANFEKKMTCQLQVSKIYFSFTYSVFMPPPWGGEGEIVLPLSERTYVTLFIRPFEKRSYYVIPLGVRLSVRLSVRPSVCKVFRFRITPPTIFARLSWDLVYSKAMRWSNAYYLEVAVQCFFKRSYSPLIRFFGMFVSG